MDQRLVDLARELLTWKTNKENVESHLKEINQRIELAEQEIYQKMQEEEVDKFSCDNHLFFPIIQAFPAVNKEVEGEFFSWLEEKGEDGIVKRTIHPQTLKAWYGQHDEWHEDMTAFLKVHEKIRIGTRVQK